MKDIRQIYSEIYDKYVEKIYRFVFLKVNSRDVAEDITSEVFTRCWNKYCDGQSIIDNPQAFLYKIARNLVIDHYRDKGRTQTIPIEALPINDPSPTLEYKMEKGSDMDNIKAVLANLKDEYREVVVLHYIDDTPISEIARIMNKSEGAIRVTLHRALEAIKGKVKEA